MSTPVRKIVLISSAFFFLIVFLLSLTSYSLISYLQSSKGFDVIVHKIQEELLESNIQLKLGSGQLRLFSKIDLNDIEIIGEQEEKEFKIKIKKIAANWRIHWWGMHIKINEIFIDSPQIEWKQKGDGTKQSRNLSGEVNTFAISNPLPFPITINNFKIHRLNLQAAYQTLSQSYDAIVKIDDLSLNMQLNSDELVLKQNLNKLDMMLVIERQTNLTIKGDHHSEIKLKFVEEKGGIQFNEFTSQLSAQIDSVPTPPIKNMSLSTFMSKDRRGISAILNVPKVALGEHQFNELNCDLHVNPYLKKKIIKSSLNCRIARAPFIEVESNVGDLGRKTKLSGIVFIPHVLTEGVIKQLVSLDVNLALDMYGESVELKSMASLRSEEKSLLRSKIDMGSVRGETKVKFSGDVDPNFVQSVKGFEDLHIAEGSRYEGVLNIGSDHDLNGEVSLSLPQYRYLNWGTGKDLKLESHFSGNLQSGLAGEVAVGVEHGPFQFSSSQKNLSSVPSFSGRLLAQIKKDILVVDKFSLNSEKNIFLSRLNGSVNMVSGIGQFLGQLQFKFPPNFRPHSQVNLLGEINIPWNVDVNSRDNLLITSKIKFKRVNASFGTINIKNVNGELPIKEEVRFEEGKLQFLYLQERNPFARVAYREVEPLLVNSERFNFELLRVGDKTYGPFVGSMAINQNLVTLNNFEVKISRSFISGESYFDIQPDQMGMGLLSRFSNLDLENLLPGLDGDSGDSEAQSMNGRTNIVIDINKNQLDGRIDIGKISSAQLKRAIEFLDPSFEDSQMNQLRTLLTYAYPTDVAIGINSSYLDLKVKTNIGAEAHVLAVPLGSQLNQFTSKIRSALKEAPLQ